MEKDPNGRQWLINQGSKYGLYALDEYENPSPNATGGHIHFSDHGEPIQGMNNGNFMYQANDANGKPFISLNTNIRTSNTKEPFNQQGIMDILSRQMPSYAHEHMMDYLTSPNYVAQDLALPSDVAKYVRPFSEQLMANRDADLKARVEQETQQGRLQQASDLAQLINSSGSVDNRRGYSALGKMFGINMPDGSDQFVNSSELLKSQVQQNENTRNYNLQKQQAEQKMQLERDKMAMQERMFEAEQAQKQAALSARAGKGMTAPQIMSAIKWIQEQGEKNPGGNNPYDQYIPYLQAMLDQQIAPMDPSDYTRAAQNWTDTIEQNADHIYKNEAAQSKDALIAYAKTRYPLYGEELAADTPWGDFGF